MCLIKGRVVVHDQNGDVPRLLKFGGAKAPPKFESLSGDKAIIVFVGE